MNSKIMENLVRVFASNLLVTIMGMICVLIFPNIMSIEGYAYYHTFTLYVGYTGILHLGFPSGLVVEYAGKDINHINKSQYKSELKIICMILAFFATVLAIIYILTSNIMALYIALIILPGGIIASYKSLYQSFSEFKIYTTINIINALVIPFIPLVYFVCVGDLPGEIYIISYLMVNIMIALFILFLENSRIKGVKSNKLFTKKNWETEKLGFLLVIGSYINVLFMSLDKQFIKFLFSTTEFAYYSFAMSTKAIMTVLITSIAQPLFPAMAQESFTDSDYKSIREILLMIGSLSGCAYFAVGIIVNNFITKYVDSLEIVGIYFSIFPAMAIINCLYINLYKIKKMTGVYIKTLIGVTLLALFFNGCFISIFKDYRAVAVATVLVYYIWLFLGSKQFAVLALTYREYIYILGYLITFFIFTSLPNAVLGLISYVLLISLLAFMIYGKKFKIYFHILYNKR